MILAITFADEKYSQSAKLNIWSAKVFGKANKTISYSPDDIDSNFKNKHSKILNQPRGCGYWLWKPYLILKSFDKIAYGDYLFYADAGTFYVNKLTYLTKQLEQDGEDMLFSFLNYPNKNWCKRDAFVLMDCDNEDAYNAPQHESGYVLFKKTEKSIEFVKKWLFYMTDERITTDLPSQCGYKELDGFRDNRHDQTVLSLLAFNEKIKSYKSLNGKAGHGLSKKEVKDIFLRNSSTYYWRRSAYPRIMVNTRFSNSRCPIILYLRVIKLILRNRE